MPIKDYLTIRIFKVLREIKVFSSLNHPNIVNYHNCWLESALVPMKTKKNKNKKNSFSDPDSYNNNNTGLKIELIEDSGSDFHHDDDDDYYYNNNTMKPKQQVEFPSSDESSNEKGFFSKPKIAVSSIANTEFTNSDFSSNSNKSTSNCVSFF